MNRRNMVKQQESIVCLNVRSAGFRDRREKDWHQDIKKMDGAQVLLQIALGSQHSLPSEAQPCGAGA
jgi:hypothetical protein